MAIFFSVIIAVGVIIAAAVIIFKTKGQNEQSVATATYSRHTSPPALSTVQNETGVVEYFANTRRGQKDNWFRFKYKKVGTKWRAYIIRMPPLSGRSADLHLTHRYSDSNGNYWVCRDPEPENLKDCISTSKVWADRLCEYIATGIEANQQKW